jgi:hypothetical protein
MGAATLVAGVRHNLRADSRLAIATKDVARAAAPAGDGKQSRDRFAVAV